MTLDDLMKVIENKIFICVRVMHDDAATEYYYPKDEYLPEEWNNYKVLSMGIIEPTRSGIFIDVEEVNND